MVGSACATAASPSKSAAHCVVEAVACRPVAPRSATAIHTGVLVPGEHYLPLVDAMIQDRGWLSRDDGAALFFLSPSRFSHTSHALFGECFLNWRTRIRIEMTAQVLMMTRWTMVEIA